MSLVIGIAGASGSGKSTVAEWIEDELLREWKDWETKVLHQDSYYSEHGEELLNWESPAIIDNDRLIVDIKSWREQASDRKRILFVEGFLVCGVPDLLAQCDFCFFLKVNKSTCRERRFQRDEWIRKHPTYFQTVWSSYLKYNKNYPLNICENGEETPPSKYYSHTSPPLCVIDATRSLKQVQSILMDCLTRKISEQ